MPADIGCVYWRTTGRPDVSPLTPWYVGVTSVPADCERAADASVLLSLAHHFQPPEGTFTPDPGLAWWRAKAVEKSVDEDHPGRFPAIEIRRVAAENRALAEQPTVEAESRRLWQTSPDSARALLTRHCARLAEQGR